MSCVAHALSLSIYSFFQIILDMATGNGPNPWAVTPGAVIAGHAQHLPLTGQEKLLKKETKKWFYHYSTTDNIKNIADEGKLRTSKEKPEWESGCYFTTQSKEKGYKKEDIARHNWGPHHYEDRMKGGYMDGCIRILLPLSKVKPSKNKGTIFIHKSNLRFKGRYAWDAYESKYNFIYIFLEDFNVILIVL